MFSGLSSSMLRRFLDARYILTISEWKTFSLK
jgi:hypothetical protein